MFSQIFLKDQPFANTYSIVAFDSKTGDIGVAVQSHWFSVGSIVSWAEAGVGAIATQSFVNPSFGPNGLALLKSGLTPKEVLDSMINSDEGRAFRQLAIIDKNGATAVYTGDKCIYAAGHQQGEFYSVQANMMLNESVWPAMAKAFESAQGSLEERMLQSLEAAQIEGGDIRGKQSVAILVVKQKATGNLWEDRKTDLRIADHKEPLVEMRRLLKVKEAYDYMNDGDVAMENSDIDAALIAYKQAYDLYPNNVELPFWTAVSYVNAGKLEDAKPLFKIAFESGEHWKILVSRINGTDLLQISDEDYRTIMAL